MVGTPWVFSEKITRVCELLLPDACASAVTCEAVRACSASAADTAVLVALEIGKIQPSEVARAVRKPIVNISKTLTTLMNYSIIEKPMKG